MGGLTCLVERWVQLQLGVGGTPVWGQLTGEQALEEVREGRLHPVRIQGMYNRPWRVAGFPRTVELFLQNRGVKPEARRVPTRLFGPRDAVNPPGGSKPPATARKVARRQGEDRRDLAGPSDGWTGPHGRPWGGLPGGSLGPARAYGRAGRGSRWTTVRAGPPTVAHAPRIDAPGGIRAVPPPRWEPTAGPPVPRREGLPVGPDPEPDRRSAPRPRRFR